MLMYGLGVNSLAQQLKVTPREAQSFVNQFFQNMPKCREWQRNTEREIAARGYLETVTGRRLRMGLISRETLDEFRNRALNFRIQSTSADLTFLAMLEMQAELHKMGGRLVLSVYDSIIVEVPTKKVKAAATLMRNTMIAVAENLLPTVVFDADVEAGTRWGSLEKIKL